MAALLSPLPSLSTEAIALGPLWRFTVAQYHEMIASGILPEGTPVELIDGVLVQKMPKHPPHAESNRRVIRILRATVPSPWEVDSRNPVTLAESEPEPDVAVFRDSGGFGARHPGPADLALVVEVSDTRLAFDRGPKQSIYARAGIAAYWIVNIADAYVEVRTEPAGESYRSLQICRAGDTISLTLPSGETLAIPAAALLP